MKQHITAEQLKEYDHDCWTNQQIKKTFETKSLDDYLEQRESEWLMSNKKVNWDRWHQVADDWKDKTSKVITIGKMIEVLGTNLKGINTPNSASKYSGIFLTAKWERVEFKADCLCDALWKAVKYVLEKELEEEKKMEEDANV
jgi:hypothetical protein